MVSTVLRRSWRLIEERGLAWLDNWLVMFESFVAYAFLVIVIDVRSLVCLSSRNKPAAIPY